MTAGSTMTLAFIPYTMIPIDVSLHVCDGATPNSTTTDSTTQNSTTTDSATPDSAGMCIISVGLPQYGVIITIHYTLHTLLHYITQYITQYIITLLL